MLTSTQCSPNLAHLDNAPRTQTQNRPKGRSWNPPIDLRENSQTYILTSELPGLGKADLDIAIEKNVLTLSGERPAPNPTKGSALLRSERATGKFSRSFALASEVDADRAKAKLANGLLTLTLPKAESAKSRKINVH